jgi:hypothetical protein
MFSARSNALVFRSGATSEAGFTWDLYDQRGQVRQSLPLRILRSFALSPDGTQIALHAHDSGTGDGEFSLVQLAGATSPPSMQDHSTMTIRCGHQTAPAWP